MVERWNAGLVRSFGGSKAKVSDFMVIQGGFNGINL